mmetsp:Transcript_31328/g.67332  ORF Transcript_31328/g.67332 Transcript_31328/m.67332 type:complete len:318 (-) Transcript_31328:178-1131(-)
MPASSQNSRTAASCKLPGLTTKVTSVSTGIAATAVSRLGPPRGLGGEPNPPPPLLPRFGVLLFDLVRGAFAAAPSAHTPVSARTLACGSISAPQIWQAAAACCLSGKSTSGTSPVPSNMPMNRRASSLSDCCTSAKATLLPRLRFSCVSTPYSAAGGSSTSIREVRAWSAACTEPRSCETSALMLLGKASSAMRATRARRGTTCPLTAFCCSFFFFSLRKRNLSYETILQTGGSAFAPMRTRSSSRSRAAAMASALLITPSSSSEPPGTSRTTRSVSKGTPSLRGVASMTGFCIGLWPRRGGGIMKGAAARLHAERL